MKLIGRAVTSCLVLFGAAPAIGLLEKPSLPVFRNSISEHRKRILEGAERIFAGQSRYFPSLESLPAQTTRHLILIYMSLHDLPKVMTKSQLAQLGYNERQTLLRSLHQVYGRRLQSRPAFIEALNDIEEKLKLEIMSKHLAQIDPSLHTGIWEDLKLLERVVDVTDTKVHRGAELQFVFEPFGAEKYLTENGEKVAAFLSRWYESTYKLAPGLMCRSTHSS